MKLFTTIIFLLLMVMKGLSQDNDVTFEDPPDTDTLTLLQAEPAGGYKDLLRYLQAKVSDGDTLGKKYSIQLYNVRFRIGKKGTVDSVHIGINHSACPIHYAIAKELKNTRWVPAKNKGIPVESEQELYGNLYFTKRVYKKYNCWPGFLMRLLF